MALLWADHLQQYANETQMLDGAWAQNDGLTFQSATPPRAGARYLQTTNNADGRLRRIFGAAKTGGAGFGGRLFVAALPSGDASGGGGFGPGQAFLAANGNAQMIWFLGSDGGIVVARGPWAASGGGGFTILGRSPPCITARTWQFIEAKCVPDPSAGSFEVRVNGVTVYNYTGDTDPLGLGEVSQALYMGSYAVQAAWSDPFAWDTLAGNGPTGFVGNSAVLRMEADADTAQADWALSTGTTGYTLLTDQSDATYLQTDTVGDKSAFQVSALPSGTTGIVGLYVTFRGLKTDAADCDVAPSIISSASETAVTGLPMTELETWRGAPFCLDPATSSPWTLSGANAATPAITRTT